MASMPAQPLEERLVGLFRHLGIERAHIAACMPRDWEGLLLRYPQFISSLTLICPMGINCSALGANPPPLLCITGDAGRSAEDTQRALANVTGAKLILLRNFFSSPWSDATAERRDDIARAMLDFIAAAESTRTSEASTASQADGEFAGITYSVRGTGSPLVLLPLALAPSQWEPLLPVLSARHCTIALGGAALGMVAHLEARAQSGYAQIIRQLIEALSLKPGQTILEVGCGSGAILRRLAQYTERKNPIVGADINRYLLREAELLARKDGVAASIQFQQGNAEDLPFAENRFDITMACTLMEEGDADRMLREFVRVTRRGGKVGVVVRSTDMPRWVNAPLRAGLKMKIEASGFLAGNVNPQGCADASLYRRMLSAGLIDLVMLPQWATYRDGERLQYLDDRIVSLLDPQEQREWREAVAGAKEDRTFFICEPFHCAAGTKP
ncbi:MAG: class I SAM-dependent methyltransferase [Deltaproteobacteria bacterium]